MKTSRWLLLIAGTLGTAGLVPAQADVGKSGGGKAEVRTMARQIEQVQGRLTRMEERPAKVESDKRPATPRFQVPPWPPGASASFTVPTAPELSGQRGAASEGVETA